ncbi:uncharacterized protein PG986_012696 [Apiospora aurea]|uniref:C2H2-type domain-containing protein n=1 Tax=Apiospora aurea TaxID=335848 RepID=A0ABR1Q0S1_9PEZI
MDVALSVDYETFDFLSGNDDFDVVSFLEGLEDFKADLHLSTVGWQQSPDDHTTWADAASESVCSACMNPSSTLTHTPSDGSSLDNRCISLSQTTPPTAESLPCEGPERTRQPSSPQPTTAALEYELPITCRYCERLFAPQSMPRHLVSKHSFDCERGCENQAFETKRDLERHYKTLKHRASSGNSHNGAANAGGAGYQCACGKPDFRKDLHKRHVQKCKKTGRGTFHCGRCDHHVGSRGLHEAHLAACLRQRGRGRKNHGGDSQPNRH